ncbi:protein YhfH [Bacillus sp. S/N-304-OC-R1]|nr:protein YhfH [Bacillus sp. S/N-304-OC-R1]MBY0121110.1 YhfH family protein [Bacillus sp. S/N-304-OC-R1]
MIQNIIEFFRNLPAKQCIECGKPIDEQHECYGNKCDHCLGVKDI